ncbi:MAG: paraquat-inducible protein A [Cypionkella sp.]|nr:paraquat-inducible protein A [Cypionkella sp.]
MRSPSFHRAIILALLIAFPIAWAAPLMRAAILPIFGMQEISILSGLIELWQSDIWLAAIVTLFAIIAPYAKLAAMLAQTYQRLPASAAPALHLASKLAMADIFLIALYIVIAKGAGHVTVRPAWGLYLFTVCILASLALSARKPRP